MHAGTQMWQLFHMTTLFLCELPLDDNEQYNCFLLLQEITAIVFSTLISQKQISYLGLLIQQYLETFKELLPSHKRLTPKCHYLVHLPQMIVR